MTKEEQNRIIKDAWVRALQKENDIPENIGDIYKNWLLTKIQQVSAQLQQQQMPPVAQQPDNQQTEQEAS